MTDKTKVTDFPAFAHLHVHTEYSLLDGANRVKALIEQTKALGMDSIAITDHGAMYGVIDFYKAAKAAGIKPVIGCEVYLAPASRRDAFEVDGTRYYHLILLAENSTGYKNLVKLYRWPIWKVCTISRGSIRNCCVNTMRASSA